MATRESISIKLPKHYRSAAFLAHHQRDVLMIAERVQDNILTKGIMWNEQPAQLTFDFKKNNVIVTLDVDSNSSIDFTELQATANCILGLQQNIAEFEERFATHKHIGRLIEKNPGLRVTLVASPFEAISWAITGQLISIHAAISIRRKLIQLAGMQHSAGLLCYPDAKIISTCSIESLRSAGLSQAKAQTLLALSHYFLSNKLDLNKIQLNQKEIDHLSNELLKIKGIGPWSINYALLRGLGWLDGSLHGDVAVRRGLQKLLGTEEKISEKETREWLEEFSPWRALVAAHLWEMK